MNPRVLSLSIAALILLGTSSFAAVHYVDVNGISPTPPYSSWATAATVLQDAVDVSSAGDEIIVTNGTYAAGGRAVSGTMNNRVAITNALFVHSVNGAGATTIQGYQLPGTTNGDGAYRCVYLAANATLAGFTLTGGATRVAGSYQTDRSGGGVWSAGGVVSDCVITGNSAFNNGGGAMFGTFSNCTFGGNFVANILTNGGGGVAAGALYYCTLTNNRAPNGGGAIQGTLHNCTLAGNSATNGGGAYQASLTNCTLSANSAGSGGGSGQGTLANCVLSGNSATNGGAAYGGLLVGCTINANSATNGGGTYLSFAIRCTISTNSGPKGGGGAYQGTLAYCTLTGNWSTNFGGGAYGSALNSCLLIGNISTNGGGVYTGTLTNCTISGNYAFNGAGAHSATLKNSIIYFNQGLTPNYLSCTMDFCCTTPQPGSGANNISADPLFANAASGDYHLKTNSPCINAGNNGFLLSGMDLDGNPRVAAGVVDIGAYEAQGPFPPSITSQPVDQTVAVGSNAAFSVTANGTLPLSYQWMQNSAPLSAATNSSLTLTNVQLSQSGNVYSVTITNIVGSIVSSNALLIVNPAPPPPVPGTHYVNVNNGSPVAPYTNWATAAMRIQDAVDVAVAGDEVVVTNGIYETGGRMGSDSVSNRVLVDKVLNIHSVNGPEVTIIRGYRDAIATNYTNIRCVYLTNGVNILLTNGGIFSGFTLTNGGASSVGGGVYCQDMSAQVSNCIIAGNVAGLSAGAAYQGTFWNCSLIGNVANNGVGGGGLYSTFVNCALSTNSASSGGAAYNSALINCTVSGNSAYYGGGVYLCELTNCLVAGNWATDQGGGAFAGNLYNCTVVGNSATNIGGGGYGFDSFHIHENCTLYNSIIISNMAASAAECECTQYDCCNPQTDGISSGNITGPPLFIDQAGGNFRLQSNSPCIDAGNNGFGFTSMDLDGNPRVVGSAIDMGAYEFQPAAYPPALSASVSGPNLILSWPLWANNYFLIEAQSMSPAEGWSTNLYGSFVSNSANTVIVPLDSPAKFYRLRR